jgi:hypothetical protein
MNFSTPEDRTKSASLYIGGGIKQLIAPLPKLKYFEGMKMMNDMMNMNGTMNDMGANEPAKDGYEYRHVP